MNNQSEIARPTQVTTNTEENKHLLMLPSKSKARETRLMSLRNTLKFVTTANNTWKTIFTGTKLASRFNIKNETSKKHKYLIYKAQCPDQSIQERTK